MGLFDNYNKIEEGLLKEYSHMFTAMGLPDTKETAKELLDRAIEKSKKEGTYNLPPNFGNIILKEQKAEDPIVEKFAEGIRNTLLSKRAEGVRDEDIKWWWNLNDIERSIMLGVDEMNRMALFIKELENSTEISKEKAAERAAEIMWKFHPKYTYGYRGEQKKIPERIKNHLPLPIELKNRINIYIEKKAKSDLEKYKREIEASSTFNALVRKEIKAGNI